MVPESKRLQIEKIFPIGKEFLVIDVRSPAEFAEDHIPGAVNFPVLDNEERRIVGTLYKQNPFAAKQLGAKLISRNISSILDKIEPIFDSQKDLSFLIYCWRGGLRSQSLFSVMDSIGYRTFHLAKGYKSYRIFVSENLNRIETPTLYVLHGYSGSGKTEILHGLKEKGYPVIDLEDLARHKGSFLGGDHLKQPSQKYFESQLLLELYKYKNSNFLILEGESKKIGSIHLLSSFYEKLKSAKKIWIELPLEIRAERLSLEYTQEVGFLQEKLQFLKRHIIGEKYREILSTLEKGNRKETAKLLLEFHYDRMYGKIAPGKKEGFEYTEKFSEFTFLHLYEKMENYFRSLKKN